MKSALIFTLVGLLLVATSLAYSIDDCKQIEEQISSIKANASQYSTGIMYAFYAKLGDKYSQLGECYQETNQSGNQYFKMAADYYKRAADLYNAEFEKKYAYLISAGDNYAAAGLRSDAIDMYNSAKQILKEHPEINIDLSVVDQKISKLLEERKENQIQKTESYVWVVGVVILVLVVAGVYYITKKY